MIDTIFTLLLALAVIAFGLFCAAMSWGIFYSQLRTRRLASESRAWPSAEGHIASARLAHIGYRAGWQAQIEYTFSANGQVYKGSQVRFSYNNGAYLKEAQATMERYPPGRKVRVFYDPNDPQRCVLEKGMVDAGLFSLLCVPLILLLPAGLCLCSGLVGISNWWGG